MQAYESMMHAFELLAWCSDIAGALYVQSRACYILKSIKSWADAHANLPTGQGGRESGCGSHQEQRIPAQLKLDEVLIRALPQFRDPTRHDALWRGG